MTVIIEFCQSNLSAGSDWVVDQLQKDPVLDIEIIDYSCLGYCGECFLHPFALVDGEMVVGETPEELFTLIKKQIQKKLDEDEEWKKLGF